MKQSRPYIIWLNVCQNNSFLLCIRTILIITTRDRMLRLIDTCISQYVGLDSTSRIVLKKTWKSIFNNVIWKCLNHYFLGEKINIKYKLACMATILNHRENLIFIRIGLKTILTSYFLKNSNFYSLWVNKCSKWHFLTSQSDMNSKKKYTWKYVHTDI